MTILQLPQGHCRHEDIEGRTLSEARQRLEAQDEAFVDAFPQFRDTHRPIWVVLEVPPRAQAPWGHEWFGINDQGRLFLHSADYDSSG